MKIEFELEIESPIEFVVKIFSDPENQKHWHNDLQRIEPIEGESRQPGSQSRLVFDKFDLLETVTSNRLPSEFSAEYLTEGICWNSMKNEFLPVPDNDQRTLYRVEVQYRFIGTMIKVIAFVLPWMFKSQVRKSVRLFKDYVESQWNQNGSG